MYETASAPLESVLMILKNPTNLLFDSLFVILQGVVNKHGVFCLLNQIAKTGQDPTDDYNELKSSALNCTYIWRYY